MPYCYIAIVFILSTSSPFASRDAAITLFDIKILHLQSNLSPLTSYLSPLTPYLLPLTSHPLPLTPYLLDTHIRCGNEGSPCGHSILS